MMTVSAEDAFRAYESVRRRLPPAPPCVHEPRHIASLEALVDAFDAFLLDAYGVLNIGDRAIPGTRDRIESLRAAGKRVLVLSNAASVPSRDLARAYRRLGYDFAPQDIVTSRDTMAASLDGERALHWGVMARTGSHLGDLGDLRTTLLDDDPVIYDGVDGFLLIDSAAWTEDRQALLDASVAGNPRPVLVANPDMAAPRDFGFSAEPGHFAHRLSDRTGVVPRFFGKPFAGIFEAAFRRLGDGIARSRVVMVGDSLHTDILGAQAAGIASGLVAGYGFHSGQDIARAVQTSGIVPDFVLDRP